MRPVLKGMCRFESLKDGTLSLADVALMNDSITVEIENNRRHAANAKDNSHG